ncbi:MAG TPA: SusD/RagB family nutrient-binding outer membrane lipoprotein, partial [Cyclobacteriaceae bacterium]|nr:SusD/RagB family nutrient-binding outer membrane lipoprotein [Cyclobacteriaceae bacterium]
WVPGGSVAASTYFTAGIKAHMDQMATYDVGSTVLAADRDTYATANPLDISTTAASLAQIGYQYWIASFLNGPEAWANFRRSGFPALTPNPYPGRTVVFITRLTYPPSEILVNSANVQTAISNMGGDGLNIKVWWNK